MVAAAGEDPAAKVLIITGVPGSFCAGTDLSDLSTIPDKQRGLRDTAEEKDKW
jgi:enoyl-CoA hydratase/carnithine racemase